MRYPTIFFLVLSVIAALPGQGFTDSEMGAGIGFSPWDSAYSGDRNRREKPDDPYIILVAERFGHDRAELMKLWHRGYGRNELIKLLLISSKTGVALKDLAKERDRNVKLSKLCELKNVPYEEVLSDAASARKELDAKAAFMNIYNEGTIVKTSSGTITVFYSSGPATAPTESTGSFKPPK